MATVTNARPKQLSSVATSKSTMESTKVEAWKSVSTHGSDIFNKDKCERKKVLEDLRHLVDQASENKDQLFKTHHGLIAKCFRDESEVCRELALEVMSKLILGLDLNDYYLTYTFPVLVERLGDTHSVETSEELRLSLTAFVKDIVRQYSKSECLNPFYDDAVLIARRTLSDKHPKVKMESCEIILSLAEASPERFQNACRELVGPLLNLFVHQQFRVRALAVRAACVIVVHSGSSGGVELETVLVPLAGKLLDPVAEVRRSVLREVGRWLVNHPHRYSHFQRIVPLMLTGVSDENEQIRTEACEAWSKAGLQYAQENDVKDEYHTVTAPPLGPWNVGCRELVKRHTQQMLGAVCAELREPWRPHIRARCAQLLRLVIEHSGAAVTQHLQKLLPAMCAVAAGGKAAEEDGGTVRHVLEAARLLGTCTPADTWSKLVIAALQEGSGGYGKIQGALRVLGALAERTQQDVAIPVLSALANEQHLLRRTGAGRKDRDLLDYHRDLVICVQSALLTHGRPPADEKLDKEKKKEDDELALRLTCYVAVCSLAACDASDSDDVHDEPLSPAESLLTNLAEDTLVRTLPYILERLSGDPLTWTAVTFDRRILNVLLSKLHVTKQLDLTQLTNVLTESLDTSVDARARLATLEALAHFLKNNGTSGRLPEQTLNKIVSDVLLTNATWHAGRGNEAVRTAALACLCRCLDLCRDLKDRQLVPTLIAAADDEHSARSRLFALQAIGAVARQLSTPTPESVEKCLLVYPCLLRRLDDPVCQVRCRSLDAIAALFDVQHEGNLKKLLKNLTQTHVRHIVETLTVHSDDPDPSFRSVLLDVLERIKQAQAVK